MQVRSSTIPEPNKHGWLLHITLAFLNMMYLLPLIVTIFLAFGNLDFTDFLTDFLLFMLPSLVLALLNYNFRGSQSHTHLLKYALLLIIGFYLLSTFFLLIRHDDVFIIMTILGLILPIIAYRMIDNIQPDIIKPLEGDLYSLGSIILTILITIVQFFTFAVGLYFGLYNWY